MSLYVTGGSDSAKYTGSLGATTGTPLTISCWVYRTNLSANNRCAVMYGDGGGSDNHHVGVRSNTTGQAVASSRNATTNANSTTTEAALESAWHHYAGVFTSDSSRTGYLDGAAASANTTSLTSVNAFDEFIVGNNLAGTLQMIGYIGHVAVWKSALTAGQITSLAGGANPQAIDAANLIAYYPLTNSGNVGEDIIGGYNLTLNGSAAYNSENPTVDAYSAAKRIVPVNFIRSQSATASGS